MDWLEEMGFGFDAISDFDLHNEGSDLLSQYRVVITGSHPEYWSGAMIEARDNYLQGGGRLMYLGGDGFYWSTAVTNDEGGLIEVRRFTRVRTWQAQPGEFWLSLLAQWAASGATTAKRLRSRSEWDSPAGL